MKLRYDAEGRLLGSTSLGEPYVTYERDDRGRITRMSPLEGTWVRAKRADLVYDCP